MSGIHRQGICKSLMHLSIWCNLNTCKSSCIGKKPGLKRAIKLGIVNRITKIHGNLIMVFLKRFKTCILFIESMDLPYKAVLHPVGNYPKVLLLDILSPARHLLSYLQFFFYYQQNKSSYLLQFA